MKLDFQDNLSLTDRIIRSFLAIIFLFLSFSKKATGFLGTLFLAFSLILFIEALFSY